MLCVAAPASAAHDFNSAIATILSHSPQLQADSLTARADLLAMAAEGNLPDPELGYSHLFSASEEQRWGVEVSQSFDWPGVYAARSRALDAAREAEEYAARARVRAKALEARLLLIDMVDANCRVAALREVAANVDTLLSLTRERFDRGDVTILTLKRMEFERFNSRAALDDALSEQDRLRVELAAMAGGTLIDVDHIMDYPPLTLLPEHEYLAAADPTVEALEARGRVERLQERVEKLKRWPGLSLGYQHEYEDGAHFNGFSIGLTLPIFSTRHTGEAAAMRAAATAAELTQTRLDRAAAIRAAHAEARRLQRRLEAYDELFAADSYLELLRISYNSGQLTAHEYLGEINDYLTLRLDRLATARSLARSLALLRNGL